MTRPHPFALLPTLLAVLSAVASPALRAEPDEAALGQARHYPVGTALTWYDEPQPSSGLVMVRTSVWESASGRQNPQPCEERDALWRGVLQTLGGSTAR